MSDPQPSIARRCLTLFSVSVAMFGFAIWVMPPLYDAFCEWTGLNGKTGGQYTAVATSIDKNRTVTVQFIASNNESMPWSFKPVRTEMKVHPGEVATVSYSAHNPTQRPMIAQAIPSLVPFKATDYFHKTECFCFNQQPLGPGEEAELPLQFIVDVDLPKQVHTITLSYTLFDVTELIGDSEPKTAGLLGTDNSPLPTLL